MSTRVERKNTRCGYGYDARVSFDIHGTRFQRCDGKNSLSFRLPYTNPRQRKFFFLFLFVNTPIFPLFAETHGKLYCFAALDECN